MTMITCAARGGVAGVVASLCGCALPYLETAQSAYRVDPVLVQWHSRQDGAGGTGRNPAVCPRPPASAFFSDKSGHKNTNDAVDLLCPVDLDVYVFPQDRDSGKLAYRKVLECQQALAPSEYQVTLAQQADAYRARQKTLKTTAAELPLAIGAERERLKTDTALHTKVQAESAKAADELKAKMAAATPAEVEALKTRASATEAETEKLRKAIEDRKKSISAQEIALKEADEEAKNIARLLAELERALDAAGGADIAGRQIATVADTQLEATCITLRNQLQDELVQRSNMMCDKHLADVKATAATYNASLGIGSLTQSTLAAIVTGQSWARALAAGASVTTGAQAIINKEVYRDYVVPAITRAIKQDRGQQARNMRAQRLSNLMHYSAGQAIGDVIAYHESCSFAHGLELIGKDVDERADASIAEIEARIKTLTEQLKSIDGTLGDKASDAERKIAERSKLRLRAEIQVLQARLSSARQATGNR